MWLGFFYSVLLILLPVHLAGNSKLSPFSLYSIVFLVAGMVSPTHILTMDYFIFINSSHTYSCPEMCLSYHPGASQSN